VDCLDQGAVAFDILGYEQGQQIAFGGADLDPRNYIYSNLWRKVQGFQGAIDLIVVGNGNHIESDLPGSLEHLWDGCGTIEAVNCVDM
jgi:hypothetical protein